MVDVLLITPVLVAAAAISAWLLARGRLRDLERSLSATTEERDAATADLRRLEPELAAVRERLAAAGELKGQLEDRFKVLASDILSRSSATLVDSTKQLLDPIRQSVERVDQHAQALEQARRQAHGALVQQLRSLTEDQERLRSATANLANALRTPHVRGRWGEVQLKRVIEYAGMVAHCDFVEQESVGDGDGHLLRPDVVVRIPGGKNVVVDAKTPLDAYLAWLEADDVDRATRLADHARQVRDHVTRLAAKQYWKQFQPAPDFVVMFVPDETFLRAAQEHDPTIQETAWQAKVIPASPTNLITVLRTIAAIWQQETAAENARQICDLGRELYERLGTLGKHVAKLGRSLDGAVGAYNEAVGSLESRVLVTARKFEDHGATNGELPELEPLERQSRPMQALELTVDGSEPEYGAEPQTLLELPSVSADAA